MLQATGHTGPIGELGMIGNTGPIRPKSLRGDRGLDVAGQPETVSFIKV